MLKEFIEEGYLTTTLVGNERITHINSPCRIEVNNEIVKYLKENYISSEEKGGVFYVKPKIINKERVFEIVKVEYIWNAIEDTPRTDGRNKSNAYQPDLTSRKTILNNVLKNICLPICFHTHPTKGKDYLHSIINQTYQSDTSEQDQNESNIPLCIEGKNLLMPRALIIGNDINSDLFIGFYNGFISPLGFEESKEEIEKQNLNKLSETISSIKLCDAQKIGLGIGGLFLLFIAIKYPKYSIPIIVSLGIIASTQITNTSFLEKPEFFNKLSSGKVKVYIP